MYKEQQQVNIITAIRNLLFVISSLSCAASFAVTQVAPIAATQVASTTTSAAASNASAPNSAASSTASAGTPVAAVQPDQDPFQRFNRGMFAFNEKIDTYLLKPVATVYNKIMPKPLNQGIHNAFNNIGELPTLVNDVLQFQSYQTVNDIWRVVINTTIGIGGLFDVASRIGLDYYVNDFGLTLTNWGWEQSNYVVLPFFGPRTIRDSFEVPTDYYYFSIYPYVQPTSLSYQIYSLSIIDRRAQLLQYEPLLEETAIDKYTFARNAYMQHRAYEIELNKHREYGDVVTRHCAMSGEMIAK